MTAEEIRRQLHALIDQLPEEQLLALEQELKQEQEPGRRQQLLKKIISEEAALLKLLGR